MRLVCFLGVGAEMENVSGLLESRVRSEVVSLLHVTSVA